MGRYEPIRDSSPTGAQPIELDERPFTDNESVTLGPKPDVGEEDEADQGDDERLLPAEDGDPEKLTKRSKSGWFGRGKFWVSLLYVLALAVAVVAGLLGLKMIFTRGSGAADASHIELDEAMKAPIRRSESEYVLSPDWDFGAPNQVRLYRWIIVEKEGNPDGIYKPMLTINGQFPGPLIEANEGDTIVVDVVNKASNATSIHWHGLFQNGTNWMDGTSGVTQCPIASNHSYRYEFTVAGQSGTYFYHGHQGVQTLDGLAGPIVVHSRQEVQDRPLPYASDRILMLEDWYYHPAAGLLRDTLSPGSESSPVPNTALINGRNIVDCSLHPDRRCDTNGISLSGMNLAAGANHRLRFLNVGAFAWFQVSVDGHTALQTVEIDGTPIKPAAEPYLMVAPGQRYSVILTPDQSQDQSAFWLRARMVTACFAEQTLPENGTDEARSIVRFTSNLGDPFSSDENHDLPTTEATDRPWLATCKDMTSGAVYSPSPPRPAPAYADHSWYFRVNLNIGDWRLERGAINGSSFRPQLSAPTLHRVLDGFAAKNTSFDTLGVNKQAFTPSELVISHSGVETVDVILQNIDEGNHPFHLHGTQFWVLGQGHGYFPGYAKMGFQPEGKGLLDPENSTIIDNPVKRDTATAEGFGWSLIRFVADNPGVWLFHCHMAWHAEAGMAMQFVSRMELMKTWKVPDASRELCKAPIEELEKGAPPKDEIFFGFHDDDDNADK